VTRAFCTAQEDVVNDLQFGAPGTLLWPDPPVDPAAEEKSRRTRFFATVAVIAAIALTVAMAGGVYIVYPRPLSRLPVSAAVLNSTIVVTETLTAGASRVSGLKDRQSWQDEWFFTSGCPTATCQAQLVGSFDNTAFLTVLTPDKHGHYTGSAQFNNYFTCDGGKTYSNATLEIQITPTTAHTVGKQWVASAFTGSMTLNIVATPNCGGGMLDFSLRPWLS
jgi:hypothetical protein